jgi:hypothetical protein
MAKEVSSGCDSTPISETSSEIRNPEPAKGKAAGISHLATLQTNLKLAIAEKQWAHVKSVSKEIIEISMDKIEYQVCGLIQDAREMHEQSWVTTRVYRGEGIPALGRYQLDELTCYFRAAQKYPLVKHLAYPLYLANDWGNDLDDWCMSVLKGEVEKEYKCEKSM